LRRVSWWLVASLITVVVFAPSAAAAGLSRDVLGCTFTAVAPHIDHSDTATNGMLKAHSVERCDGRQVEIILRTCLSYWNGSEWERIACDNNDRSNAKSAHLDVFHAGGCDLGHHRYRSLAFVSILNDTTQILIAHRRDVEAPLC
jgi:hypothetical protein